MALPSLLIEVRGGSTLVDTSDGTNTCNLGDMTEPTNGPIATTLVFPVEQTAALAELVDADLQPITSAVVEITVDGVLRPRMVITGAELDDAGTAVTVALADRRYKQTRRSIGRTGSGANLTPDFYDPTPGTVPAGWTPNPGAPDTLTFDPAGTGVFGTTAESFTASGPGPMNCVSAGYVIPTVAFDRNIGFGAFLFLPSGSWSPNLDGQLVEIVLYDTTRTDDNGDDLVVDVATANVTVSDEWVIVAGHVRVPAGAAYSAELRLFAPNGTILYQLAGLGIQEALSWSNEDVADIIVDLVDHGNDTADWGHSDTFVRADSTSVPATGLLTSRVIRSSEKHGLFDAIAEMCNVANLFQHMTPEMDGTDTFSADGAGAVSAVDATDENCDFGGWQWQGNDHGDVLGMFAPDVTDITGDRLIMWAAEGEVLTGLAEPYDLGDELYLAGPYGNYDPRTVEGLVLPFAAAKKSALVAKLKFKFDPDVLGEALTGNLRPGCLLNATVGVWPRGVDDTFLVTSVTITEAFTVDVELNRVPGGS